jgi:hypothetical protein
LINGFRFAKFKVFTVPNKDTLIRKKWAPKPVSINLAVENCRFEKSVSLGLITGAVDEIYLVKILSMLFPS